LVDPAYRKLTIQKIGRLTAIIVESRPRSFDPPANRQTMPPHQPRHPMSAAPIPATIQLGMHPW
jgi:hypothetical protein